MQDPRGLTPQINAARSAATAWVDGLLSLPNDPIEVGRYAANIPTAWAVSIVSEIVQIAGASMSPHEIGTFDFMMYGPTFDTTQYTRQLHNRIISQIVVIGGRWLGQGDQFDRDKEQRLLLSGINTEFTAIYAHAQIVAARHHGVAEMEVEVEWLLGNNPCKVCEANRNKRYKIKDAEGLIPVHLNCQCAFRPVRP